MEGASWPPGRLGGPLGCTFLPSTAEGAHGAPAVGAPRAFSEEAGPGPGAGRGAGPQLRDRMPQSERGEGKSQRLEV